MLDSAYTGTHGSFYTLDSLYDNLKNQINSKTTLSQLNNIESDVDESLNSAWEELHTEVIEGLSATEIVRIQQDSPLSEAYTTKENALSSIQEKSWEKLREFKFRKSNSFELPIMDTFERTPTLETGDKVDVYEYNYENKTMTLRVQNTEVLKVIYPKDVLSAVSWSKSEGDTSYTYSTDVWEEIKANQADSPSGSNSSWDEWAESVVTTAKNEANLGDYDLQAIYVLEITESGIAKELTQVEQFESGTKDVVLIARKS